MPQIDFDIAGARAHGFTDDQIADALAQKANFDSAGARQAGFDSAKIIQRLASPKSLAPDGQAKLLKENADETGVVQAALIGTGHTFDRISKGVQQGWNAVTGNTKAQAALKQEADHEEALYKPMRDAHPVATGIGEALPAMAVPVGGPLATAGTTAAKMGAVAAASKGLEYGTPEERLKGAAITGASTAVGGVVIPKAFQVLASGATAGIKTLAGKITPEAMALYEKAKGYGIPVNLAQLSDSKFLKTLSSTMEQIPFTGTAKWIGNQREAFTNAVSKTFGEDVTRVTPEVYARAKLRLGQEFDKLSKQNTLDLSGTRRAGIDKIVQEASQTADADTNNAIQNILGRLDDQAVTSGGAVPAKASQILGPDGQPIITAAASSTPAITKIPGSTYQSIDTELGNMIKGGGEKGMYAKRMQSAIREAMDNSIAPADQAAWKTARSQYRNLKAVRDVVAKNMGDGQVPPTSLMNALTNTEAGKEAMAMGGRGSLGELGQIGRQFVRDQAPDSRTALRQIAFGIAGGGAAAGMTGMTTIGSLAVGGATTGRLIQKIMASPKTVEALQRQGISMSALMKMPPSTLARLAGGTAGYAESDKPKDDQ